MIAALYVLARGPSATIPGVDPWPARRNALLYPGSHPVVAHPLAHGGRGRFVTRSSSRRNKGRTLRRTLWFRYKRGAGSSSSQRGRSFGGLWVYLCQSHTGREPSRGRSGTSTAVSPWR